MKTFKLIGVTLMCLLVAFPGFAQEAETSFLAEMQQMDNNTLILIAIIAIVLMVIVIIIGVMLYMLSFLVSILKKDNPAAAAQPSWWEGFKTRYVVGKMQSIEEEKDIQLNHSYDGIVELDNFMPPWLKYVFYLTIAVAVVYFVNYTVLGIGETQIEEYQASLDEAAMEAEARAATMVTSIDETNVSYDSSTPAINAGQELFAGNCSACHAMDGGGGIGPNLTDEYWIHGGDIQSIFSVVKYGVVEKGMIPWQDQLSAEEMQQVSSYIFSIQGTATMNPKDPQGEKFEPVIEEPLDALVEDDLGAEPAE
jgi:cytochrome c oxidase cbb3-type subunit 3